MYRAAGLKQKLIFAAAALLWGALQHLQAQTAGSGLKISELFPRAQTDCPEWFEITNTSSLPLDLKGCKYGDADDTCVITNQDVAVQPGGFAVLTKDNVLFSAKYPAITAVVQPLRWHAIDNYHDTMVVWDSAGSLQESVGWDYRWFDGWTSQSLARVSFEKSGLARDAWVVAVNASPGQPNSEAAWRADGASLDIGPIPFTPNSDGKDDYLSIRLSFPASATVLVSIYGFDGRKYLDLQQPLLPQVLWNGTSASGGIVPAGPFYVVMEVNDSGRRQVIRRKGILWR
jgi:hypothetical protein